MVYFAVNPNAFVSNVLLSKLAKMILYLSVSLCSVSFSASQPLCPLVPALHMSLWSALMFNYTKQDKTVFSIETVSVFYPSCLSLIENSWAHHWVEWNALSQKTCYQSCLCSSCSPLKRLMYTRCPATVFISGLLQSIISDCHVR